MLYPWDLGTVGIALPSLADPTIAPYIFETLGYYTVRICKATLFGANFVQFIVTDLCLSMQVTAFPTKFLVGGTLIYHYLGAIRHAYWDNTAKLLTNAEAHQSSMAVIGLTAAASVGVALM